MKTGRADVHDFTAAAPIFELSSPMRSILTIIDNIAGTDATVLVRGESGTGKELVAPEAASMTAPTRRDGPLVQLSCLRGDPRRALLRTELFGHEKGAFTGAVARTPGRFELADGGTLFLDEIGEHPADAPGQAAARAPGARVRARRRRQRRSGRRARGRRHQPGSRGDGRARRFREDLYYRLNVSPHAAAAARAPRGHPAARRALPRAHRRRAAGATAALAQTRIGCSRATPGPATCASSRTRSAAGGAGRGEQEFAALVAKSRQRCAPPRLIPVGEGLREIARRAAREAERTALAEVLERVRGNRLAASRILRVSYKTMLNKITEYGLTVSSGRARRPSLPRRRRPSCRRRCRPTPARAPTRNSRHSQEASRHHRVSSHARLC